MSLLGCSPARSLHPPITRASDTRGARSQRGDGRGQRRGASGRSVTGKVDTGIVKGAAGKRANVLPRCLGVGPGQTNYSCGERGKKGGVHSKEGGYLLM